MTGTIMTIDIRYTDIFYMPSFFIPHLRHKRAATHCHIEIHRVLWDGNSKCQQESQVQFSNGEIVQTCLYACLHIIGNLNTRESERHQII